MNRREFLTATIATGALAALPFRPAHAAFPTAVDCLAGTNAVSRCGLDDTKSAYYSMFVSRMSSLSRENRTAPDGCILLGGDSFPDYVATPYVSAYALKINFFGISYRHFGQMLNYTDAASGETISSLFHHAGAVIIDGMTANSIQQEMYYGRTEAQMLANIDYTLEGLAGWLTGKGVIVAGTPVTAAYEAANASTNARINTVNGYIVNRFGSKSGWAVANVNADLADANGYLRSQYSDGGCHLTAAGIAVKYKTATNNVIAKLASVGVTA